MKNVCKLLICFVFIFVAVTFYACNSGEPNMFCSGEITINDVGFEGVILKSKDKIYGTTDQNGNFNIECRANSLTIFPEKQGYFFEPAFAVLQKGENTFNFVAIKIAELSGSLKLNSVIINPTYIISYSDNYLYNNNNKDCLKAFEIKLLTNSTTYSLIDEDSYLYKNEDNTILLSEDLIVPCGQQSQIGFLINTYFKYSTLESHTTYTEYSYLIINEKHTNENLVNNQIKYKLVGINNSSNKFTFDITFVFDFIEGSDSLV